MLSKYIIRVSHDNVTWVEFPPAKYGSMAYQIVTTVDAARNTTNNMVGNTVGTDKISLTLEYTMLTDDQLHAMLAFVDKDRGGQFENYVEYYDPRVQRRVVKLMYVGNRTFSPFKVNTDTGLGPIGKPERWDEIKMDFVEV